MCIYYHARTQTCVPEFHWTFLLEMGELREIHEDVTICPGARDEALRELRRRLAKF